MKTIINVKIATLFFLLSSAVFGQVESPEKLRTGNNDLRGEKTVFKVKSHKKEHDSFALLETGEDQYMVDVSGGATRLKVSRNFAQKADGEFVKSFIHLKYAMGKKTRGACDSLFTLTLRGEREDVCSDEKEKIGEVVAILQEFKKELKIK